MSFYDSKQSDYTFNKPYSEATAEKIDIEVKKIIDIAFERTKKLLVDHRDHLEIIAKELLEKEILFQTDLERLIGKRPFAHQTTYEKFTNSPIPVAKAEEPAPVNGAAQESKEPEPAKEVRGDLTK